MRFILSLISFLVVVNIGAQVSSDSTKSKPVADSKLQKHLIVINGVVQSKRGIQGVDSTLKPDQISSINMLTGKSAIDKYGEKGKDGVVEIVTKSNAEKIKDQKIEDVTNDDNIIFIKPEVEAAFTGGTQSWRTFLEKNLNANTPIKNKAPVGTYTVIIQFVVDKSGQTSDFRALTNHGYGMEEECIRVLKLSPPWVPATQNGYKVKVFQKQPITFVVAKE